MSHLVLTFVIAFLSIVPPSASCLLWFNSCVAVDCSQHSILSHSGLPFANALLYIVSWFILRFAMGFRTTCEPSFVHLWFLALGGRGATLLQFLQVPVIPANSCDSCKNSCKFLHFAVVAGIQLSFSTNLFDIYILIIYLKVLICMFYYLISFPVIKNGNFEILNFFEKMLDLENFSTFFF